MQDCEVSLLRGEMLAVLRGELTVDDAPDETDAATLVLRYVRHEGGDFMRGALFTAANSAPAMGLNTGQGGEKLIG